MAVDRKQQMKEITERLEQGVKDIFTSEMYTTYLRTMAKFHNYSFNNTLLIAMQRPDATLVAGYNAWKNKFNRYVKKGEKGIEHFTFDIKKFRLTVDAIQQNIPAEHPVSICIQ